jgi:hypothetical protein
MTLFAHTEHLFPAIKPFGHQDGTRSDGLFLVTAWSLVGLALAVLIILLGLGPLEPVVGLG